MHAVVVKVTVNDPEAAQKALQEQVVPGLSQQPGFVHGYWTRKGNNGLSMSIWESEDAANQASERVRTMAPETVTVEDVEVREVVAHA
jgi:heme-degrading monooxygenase HmoA